MFGHIANYTHSKWTEVFINVKIKLCWKHHLRVDIVPNSHPLNGQTNLIFWPYL
jgi:hypothetical protein